MMSDEITFCVYYYPINPRYINRQRNMIIRFYDAIAMNLFVYDVYWVALDIIYRDHRTFVNQLDNVLKGKGRHES